MKKITARNIVLVFTGIAMSSFAFADAMPQIKVQCTEVKQHGEHKGDYMIADFAKVPMGQLTIPSDAHPGHQYFITATSPGCANQNNIVKEIHESTQVKITKLVPVSVERTRDVTVQDCPQQGQDQGQQQGKIQACTTHTEQQKYTVIEQQPRDFMITRLSTRYELVKQPDSCQQQQGQDQGSQQQMVAQGSSCQQPAQQQGQDQGQQDQGQQTQQPPFTPVTPCFTPCTGAQVQVTLHKEGGTLGIGERTVHHTFTGLRQSADMGFTYHPGSSPFEVAVKCTVSYASMNDTATAVAVQ